MYRPAVTASSQQCAGAVTRDCPMVNDSCLKPTAQAEKAIDSRFPKRNPVS